MIEAKGNLIDRFYEEFWVFLIVLISIALVFALLMIFCIIKFNKMSIKFRVGTFFVACVLLGFLFIDAHVFSKYYSDYIYLKDNDPIIIEGVMIGYSVATSGDDLTVSKSWPIIQVKGKTDTISLGIQQSEEKLKTDQNYKFIYLPSTRIAEIVEE